jgi:uncharacterized repeat protein (TIGR03837 family)
MQHTKKGWDIFCSVVDNYGDIGVAWRLARQLAVEHDIRIRLFVDHPDALRRIAPIGASGVDVRHWHGPSGDFSMADAVLADVVIEAFGCGLPVAYLDAMCAQPAQPLWINLEYLSAEPWVEGTHGLASRQPHRPLTRHFYFPGFTPRTGGLLRERGLLARRDAFLGDAAARAALWRALRTEGPARDTLTLSLFCYPNAALLPLLDAWAGGARPVLALVPEGVAKAELDAWTRSPQRRPGQSVHRGRLTLACVPFVAQDDYDRVLWTCDLNFVRGEDSFVRAQWAAKPLVWHCYPQAGNAQFAKLDAFLARYGTGLAPEIAAAHSALAHAWNRGDPPGPAWTAFAAALPALGAHAQAWAHSLGAMPDLAEGLVEFAKKRV